MTTSITAKAKLPGVSQTQSTPSRRCRSKLQSSTSSITTTTPTPTRIPRTIRCRHRQNPKPSPSKTLISLTKNLAISAASGLLLHLACNTPSLLFNGSGGGAGGPVGGGGGSGGGGGPGDGGFWSRLLSPAANADESQSPEWNPHGLGVNITVQLAKLSGFKKYKLSEIQFYDLKNRYTSYGDSFFEMVSLRPGGIYTKAQLQAELETLASCGMFEKVELDAKTKPDGTLGLIISFTESMWKRADSFKCINVGLMKESKPIIELDDDATDREKIAYMKRQEKEYERRIGRARPCLLPSAVQSKIAGSLSNGGKVSARTLQSIRDQVQKWYHDEGYACAQVVNFGNLNTREVVCEVVEGDITKVEIQFQDKLGNVCEGNTDLRVVNREIPWQVIR